MFKKLLIASTVLALSSSVFAAHSYKGEYKDYKDVPPAPCPTYTYTTGPYVGLSIGPRTTISDNVSFKGFDGVLSVGYGMLFPPMWYLAGEIFGGGTVKLKRHDIDGVSNRNTWSWGLSVLPGFMLTDHVLVFARLGGQQTHFNDVNGSKNKTGWHVGLGGQTNVYQNWDVRAEYTYSQYGTLDGVGKPSTDQFLLGVVYKFV